MTVVNREKAVNILDAAPTAAGSTAVRFQLEADTVLLSLFVRSITGSLDVVLKSYTQAGEAVVSVMFPTITAATGSLVLRKAATALANLVLEVTYTGACDFEVWAKGLTLGEASARILSAETLRTTQIDVSTTAVALLPVALTDRNGVIIKHWSTEGDLYIGESSVAAAAATGYPLAPRDSISVDLAAGTTLYAIASTGTIDVRVAESGG